ncbi:bifunctional DNA primase/polymerase [Streptomyces sp. DSM 41013]
MAIPATSQPVAAALWLASRGIHVHPLIPGRKLPPRLCNRCAPGTADEPNPLYIPHTPADCKCIAAGRYCHGVHAATTDPERITAWSRQIPDALWGVAAGPSGLLILDVDCHGGERPEADKILPGLDIPEDVDPRTIHDGLDVLGTLCEIRQAPLLDVAPRTLTVRTPSGGLHYWYRVPDGTAWRNNSGKLGWQLDVRAGWGYGIAPGGVTPKGTYQRVGDCTTIATLPAWLAADLKRTGHFVAPSPQSSRVPASQLLARLRPINDRYVQAAVKAELEDLVQTSEGGRNEATYRAARALGRFITTGQLTEGDVESLVVSAAQEIGLSEREALTASRSGIRAGRARKVSA